MNMPGRWQIRSWSNRRLLLVALALATLWILLAWSISGIRLEQRSRTWIEEERQILRKKSLGLATAIGHAFDLQRGATTVLASESGIRENLQRNELRRIGGEQAGVALRQRLENDERLLALNRFLQLSAVNFGSDLLYVLNSEGVCLASSNVGATRSIIGESFAHRDYFRKSRRGQLARQHAVGRIAGVQGIFIAVPVVVQGTVVGSVVSKFNLDRLNAYLEQGDAFVSDGDGVVIFATDKRLERRLLPAARGATLDPELRKERYGQSDLQPLDWEWQSQGEGFWRVATGEGGLLLLRQEIEQGEVGIFTYGRLDRLERYRIERRGLFLLYSLSGILLLLAGISGFAYWRTRRETRRSLAEQNLLLDQAQRIARVGSWQRTSLSEPVRWSDEMFRIYEIERTPAGISSEQFRERVHPDDLPTLLAAYETLFAQGESYEIEHRLRFPEGRIKQVIQRGTVLRDENRDAQFFIGTVQDVTDRRRIEAALSDRDETYRAIFDFSSDGMLILDPDSGRFESCNRAAALLFGLNEPAAANGHVLHEFSPSHQPDGESSVARIAFHIVRCCDAGNESFEWIVRRGDELLTVSVALCSLKLQDKLRILMILRDISEHKKLEEQLVQLAHTDPLTGLFNRRRFVEIAEAEVLRARRYATPLALCMLDIDHFKRINDTYGHKVGDLVLRQMKTLCQQTLRETDVVGRIGGEEFAILLPETAARQAALVAERLCRRIEQAVVDLGEGNLLNFTVSIGVCSLGVGAPTLDTLFSEADACLYAAKNSGRNRVFPRD